MSQEIVSAISTVGFPIVAYLLMWRLVRETIRENTQQLEKLTDRIERLAD